MKGAASFFSWFGGLLTTMLGFISLGQGYDSTYMTYSYYYGYQTHTEKVAYPGWVWILWFIFIIVRLIILIWRQSSVNNGYKVGCGICTLLFCSVIGGILTLCIPEDQLYGYSKYKSSTSYNSSSTNKTNNSAQSSFSAIYLNSKTYTKEERDKIVENQRNLAVTGIISQAEYERRVKEIDARTEQPRAEIALDEKPKIDLLKEDKPKVELAKKEEKPLSEDDKIALIRKYKQMKDEGIITEEEFQNKKKKLLN